MNFAIRKIATVLLPVILFAIPTLAGPPLICHSFDIGAAKSLPWTSHDWNLTGTESYDLKNLSADTIAILDSEPTVLVHMETLRRATLYARRDRFAAKQLLLKLIARLDAAHNSPAEALASFDLGYLTETYKQWLGKEGNPAQGLDGYARIQEAIKLRGNNPQMEFAAALVTLDGPASDHQDHAQKAISGASSDPLLARNLSAHFWSTTSPTLEELISRTSTAKVAQR